MSTLYIVATPIGNLGDISHRAARVLGEVDTVVCEDTRVTKKLLNHLKIEKSTLSYHAQSGEKRVLEILDMLRGGEDLAVVSDAGTPGINDPGGKLVARVAKELGDSVAIVPIPGPSAVGTALSVAGFPAEHFVYLGFPPNKKGRNVFFKNAVAHKETVVFLESPYRILKALESLAELMPNRQMVVMRELTKLHETLYRGTVEEVTEQLKNDTVKGEFVVVLAPQKRN
jgi:16S rRNA (cytidine1402-2'-O)-methyltransferase